MREEKRFSLFMPNPKVRSLRFPFVVPPESHKGNLSPILLLHPHVHYGLFEIFCRAKSRVKDRVVWAGPKIN